MTKSNQSLNPNFLLFFFCFFFCLPLLQANYTAKQCSSSTWNSGLTCGFNRISIRFPFCGHPNFNLTCSKSNTTILHLPMSGPFLVTHIDYRKQQIWINDPGKCLVKRLLTFNTSGSPFTTLLPEIFTFLICPNKVIKREYDPITCLSNSTHSFLATSNSILAKSMLLSCQMVKKVAVPVSLFRSSSRTFSNDVNTNDLLLGWDSPNCRACERDFVRCGFRKKASLEVKCFHPYEKIKSGRISKGVQILIITLLVFAGIVLFGSCILAIQTCKTDNSDLQELVAASVTQRTDEVRVAARGLDEFIIDSFTKIEVGDSKRLPGTNGVICSICLTEYASKDIVRSMPECDHCFHVECIDPWLKIHGSCPICRNSTTLNQLVYDV